MGQGGFSVSLTTVTIEIAFEAVNTDQHRLVNASDSKPVRAPRNGLFLFVNGTQGLAQINLHC